MVSPMHEARHVPGARPLSSMRILLCENGAERSRVDDPPRFDIRQPAMDMHALDSALRFVLRWEGGFVDHPDDPGGRTNCGVTQNVYDAWRARQGSPQQDVKLIADAEVHAIYASDYW